jgi:DNA modification methylase
MLKLARRRGLSKAAVQKIDRLVELLSAHDRHCWDIGDLVNQLVQSHRVPLSAIGKKVSYSKSHLSELAATARFFSPDERTANFHDSLLARRVFVRFPAINMPLTEIRDHIADMQGKRPGEVKAHFMRLLTERERKSALTELVEGQSLAELSQCFNDDWRNVIPRLPDKSVKVFNADPPFGGYGWGDEGGYLSTRAESSGLRTESDANASDEALEVTLALFDLCLPKLKDGGCLLLWQPGAKSDSPVVLDKAARSGWELPVALTWLKSNTGIVAEDYPYAPTTERILVFVSRGTKLVKHEYGLSRSDVLSYPSETVQASRDVRSGKLPPGSVHMFEKPIALMEHLIRKHSYAGELVVDCFGCSGSACIAAERLGRRWVYVERNKTNFEWGRSRVIASAKPTAIQKKLAIAPLAADRLAHTGCPQGFSAESPIPRPSSIGHQPLGNLAQA